MSYALVAACILVAVLAAVKSRTSRAVRPIAVLLIGACTVIGVLETRLLVREHQWSAAASTLLGEEVSVHCQRMLVYAFDISPVLGFVPLDPATGAPAKETWLRRDTCDALADWDPGSPSDSGVRAVHILTHEAMHMAGERDEARTECLAIQRNAAMAMVLGATKEQARGLSYRYWSALSSGLPHQYQSQECRPGGGWDENLETSPWTFGARSQ